MSNEIITVYPTGNTLYVHVFDSVGQIYNGSGFVAPQSAGWALYHIPLIEATTATQIYRANMPVVAAGIYSFTIRRLVGGTPAVSDPAIAAGRMDWDGTAEAAMGAIELAAGAIDATAIADGGANKIADHVLRRTTANIEGSSHGDALGFKSLYGAAAKQTHKVDIDGTDLDTYKSDGATVLGTQVLVTDANAEPVVTVG
jgi:hypothetical protein